MASASPVAILALPDRALAERPESKPAEAADGRFAGLMAQFTQPQAAPSPVAPARGPLSRAHRSTPRKASPTPDAPAPSAEAGHPAAAASAPKAGTPSPVRTSARAPKQHPLEAKAADPQTAAPQVSTRDTPATAAAPAAVPRAADTEPPAPEPPALAAVTVPAALLPPEVIPAPVETQAVLGAVPGPAAAVAVEATQAPGLPNLSGDPQQPTGASKVALAVAPAAVPTAGSTDVPSPSLDVVTPGAPALMAPVAAPAPPEAPALKTPAQPADPALLPVGPEGPGNGLKVTRRTEKPAPGPGAKLAPSPAAEPMIGKPSLLVAAGAEATTGQVTPKESGTPGSLESAEPKPAPDLQALANRTLDGASLPPRTNLQRGAEASAPAAVPTTAPATAAQPAGPTLIPAVLAEPDASIKGTGSSEAPAPSAVPETAPPPTAATASQAMVPVAQPQELAQLLAKAMSQPAATGAEGRARQVPPATAPPPALDTADPNVQALDAPDAAPAKKISAQPAAPALLQAISAGPGSRLKGIRGTEEPVPDPVARTAPSLATEPIKGKPDAPAALPRELAQLPAKAALQPGREAQEPIGQSSSKPSGAPVSLDLAGTMPAPDLVALANRTLDGAALASGNPPRATEAPVAPAPAAAPPPSRPAAAPPSAPVLQVEGSLRWMIKSGAQEAQLQLHPDELGQVTIHLKVEGGEVHAKVWVSEAASVQAVKEGQPHLEQALKEQGLHLGSFDLQQGHRPFQEAPSAPSLRERPLPEASVARQEPPAPTPAPILDAHHVELYA